MIIRPWMDYQTFNNSFLPFSGKSGRHTTVQGRHTVVQHTHTAVQAKAHGRVPQHTGQCAGRASGRVCFWNSGHFMQ